MPDRMLHEKMARREDDPLLLVPIDGFGRRAFVGAPPRPDFDDDKTVVVAADDVELAEPAAIAPRNDREPLTLQKFSSLVFPLASEISAWRATLSAH